MKFDYYSKQTVQPWAKEDKPSLPIQPVRKCPPKPHKIM